MGVPSETAAGGNGRRWLGDGYEVVVVVGPFVRLHEQGGGFGAKSPKPSHWGSVTDAPSETAVGGDGGR
jgi:hypothetical protein